MQIVSAATSLFESSDMTSVYNVLRETCGISQAEAAEFVHQARLDSVKSWCSDRRPAPAGVVRELKELARKINIAGAAYAAQLKPLISKEPLNIGIPHDELDARHCGFPSLGASLRAVSVAMMELPDGIEVSVRPRVRGVLPINLIPEVVQTAFEIHQTAKARRLEQYKNESGAGEERALGVIVGFKLAGGNVDQLMRFYRDEFDDPRDVGFRVLEKVLLSPALVTRASQMNRKDMASVTKYKDAFDATPRDAEADRKRFEEVQRANAKVDRSFGAKSNEYVRVEKGTD